MASIPNLLSISARIANGLSPVRSTLFTNVITGIFRSAQTRNNFSVCVSIPFAKSMTMTAQSAAISVR